MSPSDIIRVLVIDDENQILMLVKTALEKTGFSVITLSDPTRAAEVALRERPELVLSDLMMPRLDGYGVLKALRQNPVTAAIPIAFLTAAPTFENLPKAFSHGVVGYFEKPFHPARLGAQLRQLLQDVQSRKNEMQGSLRRTPLSAILAMMHTERRTGVLALKTKEGPGRVVFKNGEVGEAAYGGETQEAAIAAMNNLSDGEFFLSGMDGVQSDIIELSDADLADSEEIIGDSAVVDTKPQGRERVLLVDDDADILNLLTRAFRSVGYEVEVATSGHDAITRAVTFRPDVILSDIMMPEVDGWQLYHRVRADFRINEARFIFLSCYGEFEQRLKEVGVSADGYMVKGALLSQILSRIDQILGPRREFMAHLTSPKSEFSARVETLGTKFVLRALAEHKFTGVLRLENMWHALTCEIVAGEPRAARGEGLVTLEGKEAFSVLCGAMSGDLSLTAGGAVPTPNLQGSMYALITEAEINLTETEQRVVDTNLVTAPEVRVDERVLDFYTQVAGERVRPILGLVRERKLPREIMASVDMPPTEIEEVLRDLVRKRIINFDA